jgi:hypothetical protein
MYFGAGLHSLPERGSERVIAVLHLSKVGGRISEMNESRGPATVFSFSLEAVDNNLPLQ